MRKRLMVLLLCAVLLVSVVLLTGCSPQKTLERTYSRQMVPADPSRSPQQWQLRLKVEVDMLSKTVVSVEYVPILNSNNEDITRIGSRAGAYLDDRDALKLFLQKLAGTPFQNYKRLPQIEHYDELTTPDEYLERFDISMAGSPPEVSMAFVIDAVSYILKYHRCI